MQGQQVRPTYARMLLVGGWFLVVFFFGVWVGRFALPPMQTPIPSAPSARNNARTASFSAPLRVTPVGSQRTALPLARRPKARQIRPSTPPKASTQRTSTSSKQDIADLPGIALSRMTPSLQRRALRLLNQLMMPCGCGQTLAACAQTSLSCPRIQSTLDRVLDAVHSGKSERDIHTALAHYNRVSHPPRPRRLLRGPQYGQTYFVTTAHAPSFGPTNAALTAVAFLDYQSPYSRGLQKQWQWLQERYGPQHVRIVIRQFPLPMHPHAILAAKASIAAHKQNKFWEYQALLFANPLALQRQHLLRYAHRLHLDLKQFRRALKDPHIHAQVMNDLKDATQHLQLPGAPFFFLNGLPVLAQSQLQTVAKQAWQRAMQLLDQGTPPGQLYPTMIQKGRKHT